MTLPRLSRREALLGAAALAAPLPTPAAAQQAGLIEEVSRLVREHFYDRRVAEEVWPTIMAGHMERLAATASAGDIGAAIGAMLKDLRTSHTGRYDQGQAAYYELADIYIRDDDARLKELFPNGEVAYEGIGVVPRLIDGRTHLIAVYHGGPGARAGLMAGDEIVSAAGAPFDAIASFHGKAGSPVPLEVRRTAGGPTMTVPVTPERIRPNELFLESIRASMTVSERAGHRLGYVRPWSYARWRYQELLSDELATGRLKDAQGLVLDLRGGWGGAQPQYAELFLGGGPIMSTTNREGKEELVSFRWRRPLVVLIDEGSRSGKEVLAYGFRRQGVPLVGTRTAGALLAGRGFLLGDGSLLVLAVLDVKVEGERLEGVGVAPTVEVPFDVAYAAGADPQLEAAYAELGRLL